MEHAFSLRSRSPQPARMQLHGYPTVLANQEPPGAAAFAAGSLARAWCFPGQLTQARAPLMLHLPSFSTRAPHLPTAANKLTLAFASLFWEPLIKEAENQLQPLLWLCWLTKEHSSPGRVEEGWAGKRGELACWCSWLAKAPCLLGV